MSTEPAALQLTERAAEANTGRFGALAVREGSLGFERPGFGVRFQAESLRGMGPLAAHLRVPSTGG